MSSSASSAIGNVDWAGSRARRPLAELAAAALRRGDAEGLHFLYVRFADEVRREVGETIAADPDRVDRVTQEVFARMPAAIGGYDETYMDLERWLVDFAATVAAETRAAHLHPG